MDRQLPPPRDDLLGRAAFANRILAASAALGNGSVVSIEGSWGSGKSWVLDHIEHAAGPAAPVYRVNPWHYSKPDLFAHLIAQMLADAERSGAPRAKIIAAAVDLMPLVIAASAKLAVEPHSAAILSGTAILLKTIAKHFESWVQAGDREWSRFLAEDPGAEAILAFERLCRLIEEKRHTRPTILVDDLDRCLPHQQVAVLESLHFLVGSSNHAAFVFVAIDPDAATAALRTHYRNPEMDGAAYLQKLFDLRTRVPTSTLLVAVLGKELERLGVDDQWGDAAAVDLLQSAFPNLGPRDMLRLAAQLRLAGGSTPQDGASRARALAWLHLSEQHIQLKRALLAMPPEVMIDLYLASGAANQEFFVLSQHPTTGGTDDLARAQKGQGFHNSASAASWRRIVSAGVSPQGLLSVLVGGALGHRSTEKRTHNVGIAITNSARERVLLAQEQVAKLEATLV